MYCCSVLQRKETILRKPQFHFVRFIKKIPPIVFTREKPIILSVPTEVLLLIPYSTISTALQNTCRSLSTLYQRTPTLSTEHLRFHPCMSIFHKVHYSIICYNARCNGHVTSFPLQTELAPIKPSSDQNIVIPLMRHASTLMTNEILSFKKFPEKMSTYFSLAANIILSAR